MAILTDHVEAYLRDLRPPRSRVMAEMEDLAEREHVPIVHWETGRMLAALAGALDGRVLEVGTAIGYSTLHMAEALEQGSIVTLEREPERIAQASGFLERAGVRGLVEIVEGEAHATIPALEGPFDLLFLDATKDEYRDYLELAEAKLSARALLVVDNLLMSGEVAHPEGGDGMWSHEAVEAARAFNTALIASERWRGALLPVGDGVGLASRVG